MVKITGTGSDESGTVYDIDVTSRDVVPPTAVEVTLSLGDVTPVSPQVEGIALGATVTASPTSAAGTVALTGGGVSEPVALVSGAATAYVSPTAGTHTLGAHFTPTDPAAYAPADATGASFTVTAAPTGDVNTVTIGTNSYPLAGTNPTGSYPGGRGVNELVRLMAPQTITTTNSYGVEVTIGGDGKVSAVNDRLSSGSEVGTTIPATGYVLSGHGDAASYLSSYATVGAAVVLSLGDPIDPPPVGGGGGKVAAMWLNSWDGPAMADWPTDIRDTATHVVIGMADSSGSGTGNVAYGGGGLDRACTDAFIAAGGVVAIGIGGSSNNDTIRLLNETHATQMFNSVVAMVDAHGINGVDYDLENPSAWNVASMLSCSQKLKAKYGASFSIGLTAGLWGALEPLWLASGKAHSDAGILDYFATMNYDFPEAGNTSQLLSVLESVCSRVSGAGIPLSKLVQGFMCRVVGESYPNSSPQDVALSAFASNLDAHPELLGFFEWECRRAAGNNPAWGFFRSASALVLA